MKNFQVCEISNLRLKLGEIWPLKDFNVNVNKSSTLKKKHESYTKLEITKLEVTFLKKNFSFVLALIYRDVLALFELPFMEGTSCHYLPRENCISYYKEHGG